MYALWSPTFAARRFTFIAWMMLLAGFGAAVATGGPESAKRPQVTTATADAFAQNALNTILGDLAQEIAAGSNAAVVGSTTIYSPKVPATAVPALVGFAATLPRRGAKVLGTVATATPQAVAQGAFDTTLADLRQEIVDGSTLLVLGTGTTLYAPKPPNGGSASTAIPAFQIRSGFVPAFNAGQETDGLANLLKRSAYGLPLYTGSNYSQVGASRAANVSTTTPSQNGIFSSLARWNKPLLMQASSATDLTPASSVGFTVPDWILVNSDGTNSATANPNVVGRYAYTIYNEGGLLDMTAAGYPTGTDAQQIGFKDSLACADLTQIGLTQPQIDAILDWRSSHTFSGRQDLINLLPDIVGASGTLATAQKALQCLGTFSRTLNQPAISPDPNRPKVLRQPSTADASGNYVPASAPGGNSAYSSDGSLTDVYNPIFRSVRVAAAYPRSDGSTAVVGEPLVKKRFALSRVAWITYEGPSATASDQASLVSEYVKRGMSQTAAKQLLDEGTATNIKNYFGLTWYPGKGTNGVGGFWLYDHGINANGAVIVGSLSDAQSTSTPKDVVSANRDADFFELLKAGVNVGAIGKDWSGIGTTGYQGVQDSSVGRQILALGANIIDEASPTQFPTTIRYFFASGDLRTVYGKTDLPYYSGDSTFPVIVTPSSVLPSSTGMPVASSVPISGPTMDSNRSWGSAGTGALLMCPRIWNPYDVNSPTVPSALAPSSLRIVFTDPLPSFNADTNLQDWPPQAAWVLSSPTPWQYDVQSVYTGNSILWGRLNATWTSEDSTSIEFQNHTLYHEPTLLFRKAAGTADAASGITLGAGNDILSVPAWSNGIPEAGSGQSFIGVLLGTFPLRFSQSSGTSPSYNIYSIDQVFTRPSAKHGTWRLEYLPPGSSVWVPYQEKLVTGSVTNINVAVKTQNGTASAPYLDIPNNATGTAMGSILYGNLSASAYSVGAAALTLANEDSWDPRTDRWSALVDMSEYSHFLNTTNSPASSSPPTMAMETYRPNGAVGGGTHTATIPGWHRDPLNGPFPGVISQNLFGGSNFYCYDADGVTRRASGGENPLYAPSSTSGLPLATVQANYNSGALSKSPAANGSNRPVLLHRPYRTVAELGYVFSDTPWKNVDFSTPESGYSALLDVFCVGEDSSPDALMSGKVDLNTRQSSVLTALMSGAYREILSPSATSTSAAMTSVEASVMAAALVKRTTGTFANQGGLANISELIGRYIPGYGGVGNNGQPYGGFSEDLSAPGSSAIADIVQRFRETPIRALSSLGQAGTWNLLIDVVAQAGEYPPDTTDPGNFIVQGEQRYWLHVAIDRSTGAILDQSLEPVTETLVQISNATVAEHQANGTPVGILGAIGPNPASVWTYALINGDGSDGNAAFTISDHQLQTATTLRYLTQSGYSVRIRATDQYGVSMDQSFNIAVMPGAYTQWKITNFPGHADDQAVAGDDADPDHDGLSNLQEYALGTSPTVASNSNLTITRQDGLLTYHYTRLSASTDIVAHVYWSSDLTDPNAWSSQGITENMLSDDGTIQHWQASLTGVLPQKIFFRLQVTRP